jgi:hypothetical protein
LPQLPPTLKAVPVTQNSTPSPFSSQLGPLLLFREKERGLKIKNKKNKDKNKNKK